MLALSVLDQVPVPAGSTPADALRESIRLARLVDSLGYRRYWLAEHHGSDALTCASPEILIPQIAAATRQLRVGSGGVMLPHYSSLKVAESFRLLESLFPGRIDLGLGRAPGSDPLTAAALSDTAGRLRAGTGHPQHLAAENYPAQIADLIGFLNDSLPEEHPFRRVRATPHCEGTPQLWLLGSGIDSARIAAYFGCPYSHAHFINARGSAEALDRYRREFRSGVLERPEASLGVMALCAETREEAERLSMSRFLWWVKITKGEFGPFPTVEEALAYPYSEADRRTLDKLRRRSILGDPETVRRRLLELSRDHGVEELVVLTITHDPAARHRSYRLLAEAFELTARPAASTERSYSSPPPAT